MRTSIKWLLSCRAHALAAAIALSLAADMAIAQGEQTAPEPAPSAGTADPAGVLKPKTYSETPAEVAECMKSWDQQTGMSKEEYEKSCQRTLKYFPEKPE